MKRLTNSPFPLEHGIDRVLHATEERVEPGRNAEVSPAQSPLKPRLEQLYALPNLDDYMAAELSPKISDPSLLLPNRFNGALAQAVLTLRAAAAHDTRNERSLGRAARLLADQVALGDLVQMYRSALIKG